MGCFCLGAPPQSPNLETVKRDGKAAAAAAGLKAGFELGGELEEALIGTAVEEPAVAAVNEQVVNAAADSQHMEGEAAGQIDAAAGAGAGGLQEEGSGGSAAALLGAAGGEGAATASAGGPTDAQEDPVDAEAAAQDPADNTAEASPGMAGAEQEAAAVEAKPSTAGDAGGPPKEAAEVELEAGSAGSSSLQEHSSPTEESSQAALLPAGEWVSLKQPRVSRLSSLFCLSSTAGGEDSERHSGQEVGGGCLSALAIVSVLPHHDSLWSAAAQLSSPPRLPQLLQAVRQVQGSGQPSAGHGHGQAAQQVELEFEAAAQLVLLPRTKLLPLAQPEQALADAAGMLGRQVLLQVLAGGAGAICDTFGCLTACLFLQAQSALIPSPLPFYMLGAGRRCRFC